MSTHSVPVCLPGSIVEGHLVPDSLFAPTGELVSNRAVLKLAIQAGMPVSLVYQKREKYLEPRFLYAVDGSDYLIAFDPLEEKLSAYPLQELELVFLAEGKSRHVVIDILSDESEALPRPAMKDLRRMMLKSCPRAVRRKKIPCCRPRPGDAIVGEVLQNGVLLAHRFHCQEANRYWW